MASGNRRGAAPDDGIDIGERRVDVAVRTGTKAFKGAERSSANPRVGRREAGASTLDVALVAGQGHAAPGRLDQAVSP